MKTKSIVRSFFLFVSLVVLASFIGCDIAGTGTFDDEFLESRRGGPPSNAGQNASSEPVISSAVEDAENGAAVLYAGQHIPIGTLTITNDAETMFVTYAVEGDWFISETQVHAASDASDVPRTPGGPVPGRFDFSEVHDPAVSTYTYEIPLGTLSPGDKIIVAAHAAVVKVQNGEIVQEETAWSSGERFVNRGNWATYTEYILQDVPEDEAAEWKPETAYAGSSKGIGNAWWYYFDTENSSEQDIFAGQKRVDGASVVSQGGQLIITLGDTMRLQDVSEAVKIEGYDDLPDSRPPSGQFTLYKGNDLTVAADEFNYYVIHLDVEVLWNED